jgi:hypothetical protein
LKTSLSLATRRKRIRIPEGEDIKPKYFVSFRFPPGELTDSILERNRNKEKRE